MTGKPIVLTDAEELEIIQYYLDLHGIADTTKHFNFTNQRVIYRVLKKYNISHHSKDTINEIRKKTNLEKYGVNNISQLENVKEKKKNSSILKYNTECVFQAEDVKLKSKQTCLEKYGVEYSLQAEDVKEKGIKTCLEKYGVKHASQATEVKEKTKQTNLIKYGVESVFASEEIKNKIKQTCNEKYGVDIITQSAQFKEKTKQTTLEKYGVEYYAQSLYFHKQAKKQYQYNNEHFDSFPELCIYIYSIKNNLSISRTPIQLYYTYREKEHTYIPDFKINDTLYEIKGNHFLKEDGT